MRLARAFPSAGALAISPAWLCSSTVVTCGVERDGDQMVLPVPNATAFPGSRSIRRRGSLLPRSAELMSRGSGDLP